MRRHQINGHINCLVLILLSLTGFSEELQWQQSYAAGYLDANGATAGGSEIMHLVAHQGTLFAANGYWVDARWVIPPDAEKQSAQVLRLDAPDATWQVDLDLGRQTGELPLQYMKGNILKSVTFTRDINGNPLPKPKTMLVMAAGANIERGGAVSAWTRNDELGAWTHTLVRHGSSLGGVRWVPRDMELYTDTVTGRELLLLSLGNPGIISGGYDPAHPGGIRWSRHLEYPFPEQGSFHTRPLGMVQANGSLFMSEGGAILRRLDGERPRYQEVLNLQEDTDTDIGGIRGLTAINNPNGEGESLLFLWAPGQRSRSQIKRLDPDDAANPNTGYSVHDEVSLMDEMKAHLEVPIPYTLGAHNMMVPVVHPRTRETVHLIGFQGNIREKLALQWKPSALYGGAMYAIRTSDGRYRLHEVNNAYAPGKTPLIAPRAFCVSPFGDGQIYIGGHDASGRVSDNMAWIYRAPLEVVLGEKAAASAPVRTPAPAPAPRLLKGPIYELRIYAANEGRHRHLIKRFKEHTDRIFKRHGMESIGYWIPSEGTNKQKRRIVYILKHPSRYAAYQNWNHFTNDNEWQRIVEQPEFKGLLSEKPTSMFMTQTEAMRGLDAIAAGGIYELRTSTVNGEKPPASETSIARWKPFDEPEASQLRVDLFHHRDREQADNIAGAERLFLKPLEME